MRASVRWGQLARGGMIVGLVALAGCGYAKRKDVDAQLVQVRQDVQTADQALDGRITQVSGRVDGVESRATALEGRAVALEQDLRSMRTEFTASIDQLKGMLAFNLPVNFEYDSDQLRSTDQPVLRKFASVVKEYYPNAVVTVEGFTDAAGSRAYNLELGRRRAESVKAFLVTEGLQGRVVKIVSYGEATDRQVVPGAQGPGGQGQQNRRVSLVIDYSGGPLVVARPVTN